jgi:hypothetical protein
MGIGGLDLPRGARRRPASRVVPPGQSLAIPISALSRALAAVDTAPVQFEGRQPNYRCPACNEAFQPRDDRCVTCGRALPHAWDSTESTPLSMLAQRILHEWAAELGPTASLARLGARTFRIVVRGADGAPARITFDIHEEGVSLRGKVPLCAVPAGHQEPVYRFLLALNDQTPGSLRCCVEDDTVFLSFVEPTSLVRPGDGLLRVQELMRESEKYSRALVEAFRVKPAD